MISIAKKKIISETEEIKFEELLPTHESEKAVEHMKNDKSPGQDGLTSGTIYNILRRSSILHLSCRSILRECYHSHKERYDYNVVILFIKNEKKTLKNICQAFKSN